MALRRILACVHGLSHRFLPRGAVPLHRRGDVLAAADGHELVTALDDEDGCNDQSRSFLVSLSEHLLGHFITLFLELCPVLDVARKRGDKRVPFGAGSTAVDTTSLHRVHRSLKDDLLFTCASKTAT